MTTCSGDYPGEAIVPASRAGQFLEQSGNCPYSNGDLYELAWKGGGITISACSRRPEVWHVPPSEDDMATWLYPIITGGGEDHVGDDDVASQSQRTDDRVVTSKDTDNKLSKDKREENNTATETSDSIARRNGTPRGPRSDYTGSHRQREKKRRSKINKNLKTLQRLVPGCDKRCSQASILDLTILYIKSLQRQFLAMPIAVGGSITPAAAVSPEPAVASAPGLVQVRPGLVPGAAPPVIPFAPMVPTVMMHAPLVCRATPSVVGHGGCRHGTGTNRCKKSSLRRDSEVVNQGATMRWDQHLDDACGGAYQICPYQTLS